MKKYQLGRADLVDDSVAPAEPTAASKDAKKSPAEWVLELEELQKLNKPVENAPEKTDTSSSSAKNKKRLSQLDPVRERPQSADPLPFEDPPPGMPVKPNSVGRILHYRASYRLSYAKLNIRFFLIESRFFVHIIGIGVRLIIIGFSDL